jgi:hypothetical protein
VFGTLNNDEQDKFFFFFFKVFGASIHVQYKIIFYLVHGCFSRDFHFTEKDRIRLSDSIYKD